MHDMKDVHIARHDEAMSQLSKQVYRHNRGSLHESSDGMPRSIRSRLPTPDGVGITQCWPLTMAATWVTLECGSHV